MDGTPAAYYFRSGTGTGSDSWIVHLEGGSSCHDAAGCEASRNDKDFSSRKLKDTKRPTGIFSPEQSLNPDFFNWNHVFLNNCNAGNWGADDEVEISGKTYYFHGLNIIKAVMEDLEATQSADIILFTGSSGGGSGVGQNLDRFASWYPEIDVRGVIDSSNELDYEPYTTFMAADRSAGFAFINTNVDDSCAAAYPTEPWQCLTKEYLYPYLTTPVFTYQDLIDNHKLEDYGITDSQAPEQAEWIENYTSALRTSLEKLDGAFGPTIGEHMALPNERFTTAKIDNYTFAEILGNWIFERSGPTNVISP
jgi:hypothetical protein